MNARGAAKPSDQPITLKTGSALRKGAYKIQSAFGISLYGDRGNLVAYDTHWEVYGDEG
jgi:hypothetical protein